MDKRVILLLACAFVCAGPARTEVIPGRNVNMVSGTDWPEGDPFLQRQNEGSAAVSTRNALHLMGGGNDYRTVDIPGLPNSRMTGDAWHGVFWSRDGGHEWSSTLLPGYLQDNSPEGLASPLKGLEAGADAVLRSGTNGLVYYAGIAFNRDAIPENSHGTGKTGKLFVARYIDDNAKETGNPFRYFGTTVADEGTAERFLDKPWLAVDIPRFGAATCRIPGSGKGVPQQSFKAGNVYLSYTAVSGDSTNLKTKLMFTRSTNCGTSYATPVRITDGTKIDQGSVIAIHPLTGWVYVAWRRIDPVQRTAAILLAISIDGGRTFTNPITVQNLPPWILSDGTTAVAKIFEQGTSIVSFRTTGFPALTVDALGIVYVAWSERGRGPGGDARIVVKRSPGGLFWLWPAERANRSSARGHELMPSLLYQGGRIVLVHYNLVEDHTVGHLTPVGDGTFTESRHPAGDLDPALPGADPSKVFTEFVADTAAGGLLRRHTMELWVRQAEPTLCDFALNFNASTRVSQYVYGDFDGDIRQLQFNPPNLPMFSCAGALENCVAFIGDYVDLAGVPFVLKGHHWTYKLDRRAANVTHAVWTDNRDVRPPPPGKTWADYTPPVSPFSRTLPPQSLFDPNQLRPLCVPQADGFTTAGMRNQNLYTSRLTEGLVASSPQNTKPLGFAVLDGETVLLQRAFVVNVQNTGTTLKTFRLTIRNQPPDPPTGKASFLQFPEPGLPDPLTELFLNVGPKSSATRNVFVTSADRDATIVVDVEQATAPGGDVIPPESGGLLDTVVLNPDITNPDITNPDITNPDITNPDITNAEVYNPDITNPDITNPDITNPDITNPDITNPDITNPDITNPDITNVQVMNPDITNPDITNPDITNPDITNPDITNPDITNAPPGSYTDSTWTVKDNGNTSASYKVQLLKDEPLPDSFKAQLLLHRGYSTPVAVNCDLALQRQSVLLANIPNPVFVDPLTTDITNPDITNPDITNATFYVAPGDDWVQVTLRLFDEDLTDDITAADVLADITPAIVSLSVNTIEAAQGSQTPPIAVPSSPIVFTQPPTNGSAGAPLAPAVTVQVRDDTGAVLPGVPVALVLASNPTNAILSGNTAITNAVGIATFPNLTVDRPGAGYVLRASAGDLDTALSAPFSITGSGPGTLTVTNTNDNGEGSFRQAIDFSNRTAGVMETIAFAIPGTAPHRIFLASGLPDITDPVVIEGFRAGDCQTAAPEVVIDGSETGTHGLTVTAGGTTIRGLSLVNFEGSGIHLVGGEATVVECSYLGVDADGITAGGNDQGVLIEASSGNRIGGSFPRQRNLISGNLSDGVRIIGESSSGNRIQGNYIGTIAAGTSALPNAADGVSVDGAPDNLIGVNAAGGTLEEGNVISGNRGAGVRIATGPAADNVVNGNAIGLDAPRQKALGNALSGVSIERNASRNAVVANDIAFNGRNGIEVTGLGTSNPLRGNRVFSNVLLGIDLGGDGPTPNDGGDVDIGPNNLQNAPVLTSAVTDGSVTRIQGAFQSTPLTPLTVDVLINVSCDPSGRGEGQGASASLSGATNSDGFFFIDTTLPPLAPGTVLTALATTGDQAVQPNDTSEFSACVTVVSGAPPDGFNKVWVGGSPGAPTSWVVPDNWSPSGTPTDTDDVYVQAASFQPIVDTPVPVTRNLTVGPGATLDLGGNTFTATGDVDVADGTMSGAGTLRMLPRAIATLSGTIPDLKVEGVVQPGIGSFNVDANVEVVSAGVLDPAGQVVVIGGGLSTTGTGILRMTSNALVDVGGEARFSGGSTEDQLTAGTLRVNGNFVQGNLTSPASFSASGTHLTILAGADTSVSFVSPGGGRGTSHFNGLRLDIPGAVTLQSDVFGVGPLITTGPTPPIVLGPGRRLVVSGLNIFRLVVDSARLESAGGALTRFDDVTFQRHGGNVRMLLAHPGTAQAFTMQNVDFGLVGGAEGLLVANDSTPADEFRFQLVLTGASPPNGCPFTFGDALVTWNGTPCQ